MSKQRNALRFPSGRIRWVVASRHALAKRIVLSTTGEWSKLEAHEEGAANSLVQWGYIERNAKQPVYVRWTASERPMFGRALRSLRVWGIDAHHITQAQSEILTLTEMATRRKTTHDVLAVGDARMQRTLRALEARGLIDIVKGAKVWALRISEARQALSVTGITN